MPAIFISYRRSDAPDAVGRIYDRLVSEFGKARVFKDVDSIPLGQDFRGHLNDIIGGCAAVLAVIGPKWTDIRNEAGKKRLEDPDDFVRIELEAALARGVPVVPVLVGHAPMPGPSQLPSTLAPLAFRQSIEVRPDPDFHNDATRLVSALWAIIDPKAPQVQASAGPGKGASASLRLGTDRWLAWAIAAAAVIGMAAMLLPTLRYLRLAPPPETRIAIPLPVEDDVLAFALSPDGRQIVYQARGDSEYRLWLRSLSSTTAQPLEGTEGGSHPFWSPDGRSIGFFATDSLKRLDLGSTQPQNLAPVELTAGFPLAGIWGANGDILFNSGSRQPLSRIASTGGAVTFVTKANSKDDGQAPLAFLPDGRHFLFDVFNKKSGGIFLATLDGSPPVRLTGDVSPGAYLPAGWLVWLRGSGAPNSFSGPLLAQRLDVRNARLTGAPISIAGGVGDFSVSAKGLLSYKAARVTGQLQLTWMDRSGAELGTVGEADSTLSAPRVAPDGRRVVVSKVTQGNRDLWLLDGARASRMTFDAAEDNWPVWSPDGSRITFASNRSGDSAVYQMLASGAGAEERIQLPDQIAYPSGWSADGQYLLYFGADAKNVGNIGVLPKSADHKAFYFLHRSFADRWAQFSPDGRWVAYGSNESDRSEVFVRPFNLPAPDGSKVAANVSAVQWMVSTAGGTSPTWSPDGKELFFLGPAGEMMATPIRVIGATLVPGTPVKLFDSHIWGGGIDNGTGRQYDIAPDGRFLINRVRDAGATPTITLLQNWNPEPGR